MILLGYSFETKKQMEVDAFFKGLETEIHWLNSLNQIQDLMLDKDIGVIFITSSNFEDKEGIYEVSRHLSQSFLNLAVVLIADENSLDIRKAMRTGVFDVLTGKLNEYQVKETLKEAEKHITFQTQTLSKSEGKNTVEKKARIITVCSTKGGVGKTTFTVNFAAAFAKQFKKVAVIDLDLQFGDISMFFNCNPKKTIYEWVKEGRNDPKAYMHSYNDYLDIMPAPIRPEFSEAILDEHISHLIERLEPMYDLVLIDTAPYMEDKILTALEKSDDIFLITFLDLPTLKNSKIFIETLNSLSLDTKVKVIINRDSNKKGINSSIAEGVLGLPIFLKIPDVEKVVAVSVNEGTPYVYSSPRARISKLIYSLALDIAGRPKSQQKKSFFSKKGSVVGR
ncbi:AAA family ATPase [Neobacillus sp. SAB-20_R2A]|uniref:AAA family ATPase n=1 Tax=Neobacillus sp. SAB-20_R2A TaxID=3120519 RepID=UPI003C6E42F1